MTSQVFKALVIGDAFSNPPLVGLTLLDSMDPAGPFEREKLFR